MNADEFWAKVHAVFPNAYMGADNEGQMVVYTNYWIRGGEIIEGNENQAP